MASKQIDPSEKKDRFICSLCLENVRWRLPVATQCGHIFCEHCLKGSIEKWSPKCPMCDQGLKEPHYFSICLLLPNSRAGKMGKVRRTSYRSKPVVVYDDPIEGRKKNGIIKDTNEVKDPEPYHCLVCKECVLQRDPVATHCGHVFCHDCLKSEFARRLPKCPYCKDKIVKDQFTRLYM